MYFKTNPGGNNYVVLWSFGFVVLQPLSHTHRRGQERWLHRGSTPGGRGGREYNGVRTDLTLNKNAIVLSLYKRLVLLYRLH